MKKILSISLAFIFMLTFTYSNLAHAITRDDMKDYLNGYPYFSKSDLDTGGCNTPSQSVSSLKEGSKLFFIGDSLTYGMTKLGNLLGIAKANGFNVSTDTENPDNTVRIYGPSVEATGGINTKDTIPLLYADHSEHLSSGNVDAIIVGLGTNLELEGGFSEKIKTFAQTLREINRGGNVPIYWINTYFGGDKDKEVNIEIQKAKDSGHITSIIDLSGAIDRDETSPPDSTDEMHYSADGYMARSQFIVNQLKEQQGIPINSCCGIPNGSSSNYKAIVYNFFIGKNYSREQTLGIIGNMQVESGTTPRTLQNVLDREVGSEEVDINTDLGWGLVQWTPARKIIQSLLDDGKTYEQIDDVNTQLNFLYEQLSGTGLGGRVANETSANSKFILSTSIEEAAVSFGRYYERFKGSEDLSHGSYAERINAALDAEKTLSANTSTISSVGNCSSGVAGGNGWDLPGESQNSMVYYSQLVQGGSSDPKDPSVTSYWGTYPYGPGPISACGCGPTSFAMILSTIFGDPTITPDKVAQWSVDNDQQMDSSGSCGGSYWWWTKNISETKWKVRARSILIAQAPEELKKGNLIMTSVGGGSPLLSKGGNGHLLVMRKVTDDGKFLFADPSDSLGKRLNGGAGNNPNIFKPNGSSHTPLDAATVSSGLKGLWVIERIN